MQHDHDSIYCIPKAQRLDSAYERTRSTHYSSLPCMWPHGCAYGINPSSWPPPGSLASCLLLRPDIAAMVSFPRGSHQGLESQSRPGKWQFCPAAHNPSQFIKIYSIFTLKIYLDGNVNLPWDIFMRAFEGKAALEHCPISLRQCSNFLCQKCEMAGDCRPYIDLPNYPTLWKLG